MIEKKIISRDRGAGSSPYRTTLVSVYLPYIVLLVFSSGIYFNTVFNKYALDDKVVITDNRYTQAGFSGISDIMTHDANVGFMGEKGAKLFGGGRYRPLSIVTFAVEQGLFGARPDISHLINVLLFSLTCLLLYHLLLCLFATSEDVTFYLSVSFIASLLFAAHPIHTEVVANIKGRDEIMSLLFSLLTLYAAIRYVSTGRLIHLVWGAIVFFLALMSKENAITFIAIVPLTYYFFTGAKLRAYLITVSIYLIPVLCFLYLRSLYTQSGLWTEGSGIFNNPFVSLSHGVDGYIQRYATIIMIFLLYFKVLLFPHPLTHDYYYDQISIVGATGLFFILSVIVNVILFIYAIRAFRRKSIPSYAILFYYITFSVVSNLIFTTGILMNERFVYSSSIGFCILLACLLAYIRERYKVSAKTFAISLGVLIMLYSAKVISRNMDWRDEMTLEITDAKTSANSAKAQNVAGTMLVELTEKGLAAARRDGSIEEAFDLLGIKDNISAMPDQEVRKKLLVKAIEYLNRSIAIYPTNSYSWFTLGTASYRLNRNPEEAISDYQKALGYGYDDQYNVWNNIGCIELDNRMYPEAKDNFIKVTAVKPDEAQYMFNLALAYTDMGIADSALYWYSRILAVKPNDARTYHMMGKVYGSQMNDLNRAIDYITKAISIDPDLPGAYADLGMVYNMAGRPDDAISTSMRCIQRFPDYVPALMNMAKAYHIKNEPDKEKECEKRIAQLTAGHSQ